MTTTHESGTLWLDLTNGCNLQCRHCYSDSSPNSHTRDRLSYEDYRFAIDDAKSMGFQRVQFIGGEPLLNKDLPRLIRAAHQSGIQNIEVYSNLTFMPDAVLDALLECRANVATSVYSASKERHDAVTSVAGSLAKTLATLERLVAYGVRVRASYVEQETNRGDFVRVLDLVRERGVSEVAHDTARPFGRAAVTTGTMESLCGACAGATACVGHDGLVSPCIMSRDWALGSILASPLRDILSSERTAQVRQRIHQATKRDTLRANCGPQGMCGPTGIPVCGPQGNCGPNGTHCLPNYKPRGESQLLLG